MTCRSCGATIADKAIVCYRCGTPTDVPPAPVRPAPRARTPLFLAAVALAVVPISIALAIVLPEHRTPIAAGGGLLAVVLGGWAAMRWPGR